MRWEGPIGFEGQMTGDGRWIQKKATRWADLPLPLRAVFSDVGAHDGAVVVGTIERIERRRNGVLWGSGTFDMDDENGREAARRVGRKTQRGISMDLDEMTYEIRVKNELLETSDGESPKVKPQVDGEGRVTVMTSSPDDEVTFITDTMIRSATIVAIPAFRKAQIHLIDDSLVASTNMAPTVSRLTMADLRKTRVSSSLTASAIPVNPPKAWFEDPGLTEPTPLTVTEDGRVFGHLAAWGTCHASFTATCVQPPSSPSNYTYFQLGAVRVDDGTEIPTGRLTMGALHAKQGLSPTSTVAHYEDTGLAVADVRAGEDAWGIWLAGSVRPDITPEQLRAFRASPLSGDWRRVNGHLELVAALSVNVPGFPIPRPQAMVASGQQLSLVASGVLAPDIKQRLAMERIRNFRADELARRIGSFNVNQPRAPKGASNGGQWVKGGSGSVGGDDVPTGASGAMFESHVAAETSRLLERASIAEKSSSPILQQVMKEQGGELYKFEYRLKASASLSRKIRDRAIERKTSPEIEAEGISDALRYTAMVAPNDVVGTAKNLETSLAAHGHKVLSIDNAWANDDSPFHGISMNMQSKDGLKWELQVQTPDAVARAGESHFWYDFYRDPRLPDEVRDAAQAKSVDAWQGVERPNGWESIGTIKDSAETIAASGKYVGGKAMDMPATSKSPTPPKGQEGFETGDKADWGGYRFVKISDGWRYLGKS